MTAFDFLHNERLPVLHRLIDREIPDRLHAPLVAVLVAVVTASSAWMVELYRLHAVEAVERAYQIRFQDSEREVAATKIRFKGLEERAALDRRIVEIRASGGVEALRLADIANHLPGNTWISAIGKDASGIAIEGKSADLRSLAQTIDRLARARKVRNPVLLSADADAAADVRRRVLRYRLRLDAVE